MRRIIRHSFNLVTAASLVMFAAVGVLWVRSYWVADHVVWWRLSANQRTTRDDYFTEEEYLAARAIDDYRVVSDSGFIWSEHTPHFMTFDQWQPAQVFGGFPQGFPAFKQKTFLQRWGFKFDGAVGSDERWMVGAPHAAIVAATAVAPAVWLPLLLRRRRGARRIANGQCPACGYDMRATPNRCPECGMIAEPPTP